LSKEASFIAPSFSGDGQKILTKEEKQALLSNLQ